MVAPEKTVWGQIVKGSGNPNGRQGKIGIYVDKTVTATQVTIKVQVWFWTIYSCDDYYCTLYYNAGTNVTSATTVVKTNCDIKHKIATGTGWNTANQTMLYESAPKTYTRGSSSATYKAYAKFSGIDMLDSAMKANTSYTIDKLDSYTITYDANGGSGAPSSQTKYYGKSLTLSTKEPTRANYSFQGWATSASGSKVYDAGDSYTSNAKVTLYAVWKADTYKITYNANGGSGAPSEQTKTYGVTLKLSTTKPTRENYTFLGWSKSSSATTATYVAGANFTDNAKTTLYAVWKLAYSKPTISNFKVFRCTEEGAYSDDGDRIRVSFEWSCFYEVTDLDILVYHKGNLVHSEIVVGRPNPADRVIDYTFDANDTSTVSVRIADKGGSTTVSQTLPGGNYTVDFLAGGKGVAIGKSAEWEDVLDVNMRPMFRKPFCLQSKNSETLVETLVEWKPYLTAGDTVHITLRTAGYVTNAGSEVSFCVPLSVPIVGVTTVAVSSGNGFILRQGTKYTHGSAYSDSSYIYAVPDRYSAEIQQWCTSLSITAVMTDTTNVTNNDAVGIYWDGYITFS